MHGVSDWDVAENKFCGTERRYKKRIELTKKRGRNLPVSYNPAQGSRSLQGALHL